MIVIYDQSCRSTKAGRMIFHLGPVRESPLGVKSTPKCHRFPLLGVIDMALTMTTIQQCTLVIKPVDAHGHPAKVDDAPVWLTDNTDVLSLVPSTDGMSCVIAAVGIPGTAKVQVTADADLGSGVSPLVGTLDVEVVSAPAVNVTIEAGTPTDV